MTKKINLILRNIEELMEMGDYENAKRYLVRLIKEDPKNPEPHYLLGDVYCKLQDFTAAIKELEIANFLLPQNPQIFHLLGWANFMNGDIVTGRKLMETALSVMPDDVSLLCDLAVLETRDMNEKALEYAGRAMKINPDDPMVREVFVVTNRFIQAWRELKKQSN